MKRQLVKGSTSVILDIFIQDSSSTTGAGLTGLVFNTASLTCYYHRNTASAGVAVSLITMTVGTFTSSGFKEVDSTNLPGLYQLCLPDAAFATSATSVSAVLKGAANMAPLPLEIELTAVDHQDAVRFGLTALPNVASGSAGAIPTTGTGSNQINVTGGRADADVLRWNGTAVSSPATAGIPDVNVKNMNNVAATSITTVNANQGTTQPVNYTGTGASALVKSDMVDVAGAAVSTSTAQIGVNAVNIGGTAQTGRDIGASVLLSSGTGTGQLDFTSGVVKSNLVQIIATALTETTGGFIAAAFKKFFDKATPTGTINSIPDAVAGATGGLFIAGTNAATTVTTSLTTTFTGNLTGSVGSVTGAVGSVTGAVGSIATGGIAAASFAAGAIDAAAIAANAIGASELATDAVAEIADQVWDELLSGHAISGSTGAALSAAGSAGDPWSTALPGAYGAGTAGAIVGTNLDATVSSRGTADTGDAMTLASGSITAAVVATGAIDADALATDAVNEIADGLLNRDMSTGTDSGSTTVRTVRQALRFLRNKWSISGSTLTVTKEDDSTSSWTSTLTTSASADPVTASDPA